jgi:hypothetical protein
MSTLARETSPAKRASDAAAMRDVTPEMARPRGISEQAPAPRLSKQAQSAFARPGSRLEGVAARLRQPEYSLTQFLEEVGDAIPELGWHCLPDSKVVGGWGAYQNYERTVASLFAAYWLLRVGVDGERGFCWGVDDGWEPPNEMTAWALASRRGAEEAPAPTGAAARMEKRRRKATTYNQDTSGLTASAKEAREEVAAMAMGTGRWERARDGVPPLMRGASLGAGLAGLAREVVAGVGSEWHDAYLANERAALMGEQEAWQGLLQLQVAAGLLRELKGGGYEVVSERVAALLVRTVPRDLTEPRLRAACVPTRGSAVATLPCHVLPGAARPPPAARVAPDGPAERRGLGRLRRGRHDQ